MKAMTQDQIDEVLLLHGMWLCGREGGVRANLRGANLTGADLSRADLRHAILTGANLTNANLRHAVLSIADFKEAVLVGADLGHAVLLRADLTGANLRGVDLTSANLTGAKGIIMLPAADMRGHSHPHAVLCGDEWRVRVGCRDFSIAQARQHWGSGYDGDREQGDIYLHAIDWLEGWIERRMANEQGG